MESHPATKRHGWLMCAAAWKEPVGEGTLTGATHGSALRNARASRETPWTQPLLQLSYIKLITREIKNKAIKTQKDPFHHFLLYSFLLLVCPWRYFSAGSVRWKLYKVLLLHISLKSACSDPGGTEIGHGGSTYTSEISKLCKPRHPPPAPPKKNQ